MKQARERERAKKIQASNMIAGITSDMEPGAGIDKSWVPTLQHIGWIRKPTPQGMQSISWNPNTNKQKSQNNKIRIQKSGNPNPSTFSYQQKQNQMLKNLHKK